MRCERGPAWRFPRSGRFQAREETAMTTPVASATPKPSRVDEPRPADVFVAFGITGDLAKEMTFMSLYRLERRGLHYYVTPGCAFLDLRQTHHQGQSNHSTYQQRPPCQPATHCPAVL